MFFFPQALGPGCIRNLKEINFKSMQKHIKQPETEKKKFKWLVVTYKDCIIKT